MDLNRQVPPAFAFIRGGCPMALVAPVVVQRDGHELVFIDAEAGVRTPLSWPSGFSARVLDGTAELVTPGGIVFAREGDVLATLSGGVAESGDIVVCFDSVEQYERVD